MADHESNIPQLNDDYNFLVHFAVNQAIRNKQNSLDEIFDAFKSHINQDDIREIFVDGLDTRFKKSNNFKIIQAIYHTFDSDENNILVNTNGKKININNDNKRNSFKQSAIAITPENRCPHLDVFRIQNLMCSIFSYLDFQSLLKCSHVNQNWLYDSYCPMSTAFISTKNMYKENRHNIKLFNVNVRQLPTRPHDHYDYHHPTEKVSYQCFHNINRFKNVSSLQISYLPPNCKLDRYFRNLEKFRNISKLYLETDLDHDRQLEILSTVIENNKNKLKTLTIYTISRQNISKCTFLQSIFLSHLTTLRIIGMNVQALKLLSQSPSTDLELETSVNVSFNNFDNSKLQHVVFDSCHLDIEFWRGLDNGKTNFNLTNMTHLSFIGCTISSKDEKIIESEYIAKMVSKLDSLTHFKCHMNKNCYPTSSTDDRKVSVVKFLSSFLYHLSQRKGKAKNILKSLDIVLTTEWFFHIEERNYGNSRSKDNKTDITIKTDEFVLNFEKLEDVSISFNMCDIPSSNSCRFKHSDQVRLIQKTLRIFCITKESNEVKQQMHMLSVILYLISILVVFANQIKLFFSCVFLVLICFVMSNFI